MTIHRARQELGAASAADSAVGDAWPERGIAGKMLERVATSSRAASIEQFSAICLATHRMVIRLLSRLGPTTVWPCEAGLVELGIDLTSKRHDSVALGPASGGRRDWAKEPQCPTKP